MPPLQAPTSPLALTLGLDASALELGHEYRPNPSAISSLCNRHMGVGLGFNCGKRRSHPTLTIHTLKLSRPAALPKLLPHCCLPFLSRFCRQVACIFLPSAWSDYRRRGRVLSRCYLLPLPMVYQEGSWLQDRSVRTNISGPFFGLTFL